MFQNYIASTITVIACSILGASVTSAATAKNPPVTPAWGTAIRISKARLEELTMFAAKIMEKKLAKMKIDDQFQSFQAMGTGDVSIRNINLKTFQMPKISIETQQNRIKVKAMGGKAEATADWQFMHSILKFHEGSATVKVSDIAVKMYVAVRPTKKETLELYIDKCELSMSLKIKATGGVLASIERLLGGAVDQVAKMKAETYVCSQAKNYTNEINKSAFMLALPISAVNLTVDLSLTEQPQLDDKFMTAKIRTDVMATGRHRHPQTKARLEALKMTDVPAMPMGKEKLLQVTVTEFALNTGMDAIIQQFGLGIELKDTPQKPISFLRTTCPGIPPLCVGRFIRHMGHQYPNSNVTMKIIPKQGSHARIGPEGITVQGAISLENTVSAKDQIMHKSAATFDAQLQFDKIVIQPNGQFAVNRIDIMRFVAHGDEKNGVMSELDIDRIVEIGKPVMKFFIEDVIIEKGGAAALEKTPIRLQNPELRLVDGAIVFETDVDLRNFAMAEGLF